jgi:hypothetical protein
MHKIFGLLNIHGAMERTDGSASSTLQMPEPQNQEIMRRLGDYCKAGLDPSIPKPVQRKGMSQDLAMINPGTFIMQFGTLIARETIFKDWPNIEVYEKNAWPRLSLLA